MKKVTVNLGPHGYPICIGKRLLGSLGSRMVEPAGGAAYGKKVLLVSSQPVYSRYGDTVKKSLERHGFEVIIGEIGDGEEHKTIATACQLYDLAFDNRLDRRCPVVALGGGVTGDVAGFVAATYLRGVPLIQVPTTLLAQVDSSIGGKVAVNHPRGKNIIGAFYQPRMVLADTNTLSTLSSREMRSGLAEVIKYGVIWSENFFSWLEENIQKLLEGDREALATAVWECCRVKARVVEEDETEQGLRGVLNFGHTVGHAVEVLTGYGTFTHGEAVAIGMVAAARLAEALGMLNCAQVERVVRLTRRSGLPANLPEGLSVEGLLYSIYRDKKVTGGRLAFVLPKGIGKVVKVEVEEAILKSCLKELFIA